MFFFLKITLVDLVDPSSQFLRVSNTCCHVIYIYILKYLNFKKTSQEKNPTSFCLMCLMSSHVLWFTPNAGFVGITLVDVQTVAQSTASGGGDPSLNIGATTYQRGDLGQVPPAICT